MRRRTFITAFGAGLASWPLCVGAQPSMKSIGFLGTTSASAWGSWVNAFTQRLNELNWVDGRNIAIEYRWAEGNYDRFTEIASRICAAQGRCDCDLRRCGDRRPAG